MLKFITEEYLRELYRKEPFEFFQMEDDIRLTPGGRQYLSDKRIKIVDKKILEKKEKLEDTNDIKVTENILTKKKLYRLNILEMDIYNLVSEFIRCNLKIANEMLEINKILHNIIDNLKDNKPLLSFEQPICQNYNLGTLESYLYFKNGKYVFSLKKIVYEILYCKEFFLKNEKICKNFDIIVARVERVIYNLTEEI